MAGRSWNRNGPGYGIGGGYMGPNAPAMGANMGYYVNPVDRRPMYTANPMVKPYGGAGYRDDGYRRPRDDYRGGKRPRGRSPVGDRRPHGHDSYSRKDSRSSKRPQYSGRYEVKVPKLPLTSKFATVPELKLLHHGLNIPNDFSKACFTWQEAFPLHEPMNIATKTDVYILHKDVESQFVHPPNALEAPDADYSYSVRVMPVASPELAELYKHTFRAADEKGDSEKVAAIKNIHFVVGGKSKVETMAIGGPWSPSLDGPDPESNPQTLINTAIRTFKGFTGVDLSSVNEWVRFLEIRYYRGAGTKAPTLTEEEEERFITEDKQEVVVFLIPEVSHLIPSDEEWEQTRNLYGDALQKLLAPMDEERNEEVSGTDESSTVPAVPDQMETSQATESAVDESLETPHPEPSDGEPTHYSRLDVNSMKVTELRAELIARNLDSKGVKANLVCRLQNALDDERKAELSETKPAEATTMDEYAKSADDTPSNPAEATGQSKEELLQHQSKEISEKERRRLERLYRLGDKPAILVYPNRAARGGRFDCHRVSLHSLLNYQAEEQKELNFEVSLFAEQFHTMLQRDCAFTIFKAIYSAPEKDTKDVKSDQNGHDEPDSKRRRDDDSEELSQIGDDEEPGKPRKMRRTVDFALLFAFTFFDSGHASFIRDYDLTDILQLLNLGYTKSQMRKLVAKVTSHRDHVRYRNMTDQDVVEGDVNDVTTLKLESSDPEFVRDLAAGNDLLFGGEKPQGASKVIIASASGDEQLLKRVQASEEAKKSMEFQFFQIKEELEKTRVRLNSCKDFEDRLKKENREFQEKLREEQRASRDNKSLVSTYNYLLRHSRELMTTAVAEIDKQFEKEKAKREAEKAVAEAEKAKREAEDESAKVEESAGSPGAIEASRDAQKAEEKPEWEVVDQV
uniref:SAP domain-containing protein n=1 Tax=Mesocestoides corti TaxID=53468 RepID=A0A5K3F7Z0_MESCO